MQESLYRCEIWRPSDEYINSAPLGHCEWVDGELRLVGLDNNTNQDTTRREVEVARLRLESPSNAAPWARNEDHQIRTWATQREEIGTFMQSLADGSPHIILTPAMALDEHGRVVVKLHIGSKVTEAAVGPKYQIFWENVARCTARALVENLSRGIEEQLSGFGLYPESSDEDHVEPDDEDRDRPDDEDRDEPEDEGQPEV